MGEHSITKCRVCGKIIRQCRCTGPHRVEWSTCKGCTNVLPFGQLDATAMRERLVAGGVNPDFLVAYTDKVIAERERVIVAWLLALATEPSSPHPSTQLEIAAHTIRSGDHLRALEAGELAADARPDFGEALLSGLDEVAEVEPVTDAECDALVKFAEATAADVRLEAAARRIAPMTMVDDLNPTDYHFTPAGNRVREQLGRGREQPGHACNLTELRAVIDEAERRGAERERGRLVGWIPDHTSRLVPRVRALADEQKQLATGASFEHRARCATDLIDAADALERLISERQRVDEAVALALGNARASRQRFREGEDMVWATQLLDGVIAALEPLVGERG